MRNRKLIHALATTLLTMASGLSTADDIEIYGVAGLDVPKGDVSYWPTVMLAFDITSNATATFCQVDAFYDHDANTRYRFVSRTADFEDDYLADPDFTTSSVETDDCQRLINDGYLNERSLGGLPAPDADWSVSQQVKRIELYAMALRKAMDEVVGPNRGLRIGTMFPHMQEKPSDNTSNGGFIALGFGPTQDEVDARAGEGRDCTSETLSDADEAACATAAFALRDAHVDKFVTIAGNASSLFRGQHDPASPAFHTWAGAEMYLELYRYLKGGRTFRADQGLLDFGTTDAANNLGDSPESVSDLTQGYWDVVDPEFADADNGSIFYDVSWDTTIINVAKSGGTVTKTYVAPELKCIGTNVINFIHSQSSDDQPSTSGQNKDDLFYSTIDDDAECTDPSVCGIELTSTLIKAESTPNDVTKAVWRKMSAIDLLDRDTSTIVDPEGVQGVTSYAIFNSSNPSRQDRALGESGGGRAYPAGENLDDLVRALKDVLLRIISESSTFTAPALTANALNRTDILNDVFLALFQAEDTPFWPGNIKKLRLAVETGGKEVVAGVPDVIDGEKVFNNAFSDKGLIQPDVVTYWTDVSALEDLEDNSEAADDADGRKVERGGAGQNIPDTRTILTESGGVLMAFTTSSSGLDADDVNYILNPGDWKIGDTLHSRPAAINYGFTTKTRQDNENPDVRIVFGSNDGLFRMFQNTTGVAGDVELNGEVQSGVENWGFIPREIFGTIPRLRDAVGADEAYPGHPITVDGVPVVIQVDRDGDNRFTRYKIDDSGETWSVTSERTGDIVWAFFGLRRGGKAYYALDLLDPEDPKFMWKIGKDDTDDMGTSFSQYKTRDANQWQPTGAFAELAQSWSTPQFGVMHVDQTNLPDGLCGGALSCNVPVLAFGGGYNGDDYGLGGTDCSADLGDDAANRGCTVDLNAPDNEGNAVFIVHAETGTLIWKLTHGTDTGYVDADRRYTHPAMVDSVAADVAFIDKDDPGLHDTVYFSTTGGDLWRINLSDMSIGDGTRTDTYELDDADPANWRPFPLLSIGRLDLDGRGARYDRRFLSGVSVTPTGDSSGSYDAILLGSGDRENPTATGKDDAFYLFKDPATKRHQAPYLRSGSDNSLNSFAVDPDLPAENEHLAWVNTAGVFVDGDGRTIDTDPNLINGWRRGVSDPGKGEKVVGAAVIIGGMAFFTTYIPTSSRPDGTPDPCAPSAGTGRAYALDIADASSVPHFTDADGTTMDPYLSLQTPGIPPPVISVGSGPGGGSTDKIYIQGRVIDTGAKAFFPTFWRRDEW